MAATFAVPTPPVLAEHGPIKGGLRRSAGNMEWSRPTKRVKRVPTFPVNNVTFEEFTTHSNVFYVDKTRFIPPLEALGKAVILLAPRRFGKTLFLDTLASYYDISKAKQFDSLFGRLWIGSRATEKANSFHVLKMTFRNLGRPTASAFGKSMSNCLQLAIIDFCKRYELKPIGTTLSVLSLCEILKEKNEKVMILIDDYDGLASTVSARRPLLPQQEAMLNQIQTTFQAFFSILQDCIDLGNVQIFMTGVLPLKLTAKPDSGFHQAMYHYPWGKLSKLFGFTIDDVSRGVSMLELPSDCSEEELTRHLAMLHIGYRFRRCSLKSLFNPARIQFILDHLSLHVKFDPTMTTQKMLRGLAAICEPSPSSISTALSAASIHPMLHWILRECLYSTSGTNSTELEKFDLLDLAGLAAAQKSTLLSYLCFTGALTHELVPNYQNPYRLTVPNGYARTEFLNHLREAVDVRNGALANLHASIRALSSQHQVGPLVISLQDQLLTAFESYDTGLLEHELRTLTYSSLLMCCLQGDDVYSEPKLETCGPNLPFKNMYGSEDQYSAPGTTKTSLAGSLPLLVPNSAPSASYSILELSLLPIYKNSSTFNGNIDLKPTKPSRNSTTIPS